MLDLRCQLRLQRQVSPVRTQACLHLQTVDLASLLALIPAARLDQLARQRDILEEPLKVCRVHCKKRLTIFPAKESLVCDILAGDGKIANLFHIVYSSLTNIPRRFAWHDMLPGLAGSRL